MGRLGELKVQTDRKNSQREGLRAPRRRLNPVADFSLARAVSIERVSHENAGAQKKENSCHDLCHRITTWRRL